MKTFKLTWVDEAEATYPGIETDGRQHTYQFQVESMEDAKTFVRSFVMINPDHNFQNYDLREVNTDGE